MNRTRKPLSEADADPLGLSSTESSLSADDGVTEQSNASGYLLTLYVASLTPRSIVAIQSIKEFCERHLRGQYSLEIVDIYEYPSLAKSDQIIAAPTLIKRLPLPLRRLIGDMTDEHRVLVGLDLRAREEDGWSLHRPT
ncbi:circadian clock KaiB family protein [Halochromatium glycolicum]|jgi:circadian clock protein KaiB|uniref:Thiol-disulfide isomerase n=1 Tax=Halochromatium glycolicum TaxID=85075 RepID=A0AAJ0U5J3_9GAMM|nr:circadian clock KaiB family protein [Halochromatium glycolicum]MBK1705686.1 thiol-disulfide isomerase [Halochromatium glycolicum]